MKNENQSGHTAGPWWADVHGNILSKEHTVGTAWGNNDRPPKANARLIAAAPDLLEALQQIVYVAKIYAKKDGDGLMVSAFQDFVRRGESAINKAIGDA